MIDWFCHSPSVCVVSFWTEIFEEMYDHIDFHDSYRYNQYWYLQVLGVNSFYSEMKYLWYKNPTWLVQYNKMVNKWLVRNAKLMFDKPLLKMNYKKSVHKPRLNQFFKTSFISYVS